MTKMLPTHDAASAAVMKGTATALDSFICDYEPAPPDDVQWRKQLEAVVAESARHSMNRTLDEALNVGDGDYRP